MCGLLNLASDSIVLVEQDMEGTAPEIWFYKQKNIKGKNNDGERKKERNKQTNKQTIGIKKNN